MDIEQYRKILKSTIEKHSECDPDDREVETQIAFDVDRDRYLMFHVGWRGERRVFGCVIHIEIRSGKIWIQRDFTEVGVANELVELGVPKTDIVLGFEPPFIRQFTEFAMG